MQKHDPCDISVIIVSYNTADLLIKCLDSITSQGDINYETIVVDNASSDETREAVKNHPSHVKLLANETNVGFARANNMGWKVSGGSYLYFLNPDTVVHPGTFEAIVEFMEANPEIGLAGTSILNPDGSTQSSVEKRYPGQRHAKNDLKGLRGDIAWVLGASIAVRRTTFEQLGGFDERFFLYAEDIDLCLCGRRKGWEIGYIQNAGVTHLGGQSEKNQPSAEVWRKKLFSEILFYRKHYADRAVKAIIRSNILQAYWRLLFLNARLLIASDNVAVAKKEKYGLLLKAFREAKSDMDQ